MRDVLLRYTFVTGRMAAPPIWALGNHQCRFHDYDAAAAARDRPGVSRARHPVRRAVARHRSHGRLPRVHLGHGEVSGTCADARVDRGAAVPPGHDRRSRREDRAGLRRLRGGSRTEPVLQDRGRKALHRPGLAGAHCLSGFRQTRGARLVGVAHCSTRCVRHRRDLERHERARDRRRRAVRDALRSRRRRITVTSAITISTRF